MGVLSTLPWFAVIALAEAGYYKVRPPPPPPLPPGSIHYGPHPPSTRYHSRPSASRYPPPPSPYYPHHHHYSGSRPSYSSPVKASSGRHYARYPVPPSPYHVNYPKPVYSPYAWKHGYNAFRAPVVKETFITPQTTYTPTLFKDDDKGPIHTIPAPNLGPSDKPASLFSSNDLTHHEQSFHEKKPLHSTQEDLAAVLRHGLTKVNTHQSTSHGYQVTEDPSLHQPHTGPSYFAPDPDPEVPSVKVPPTTDPHSLPSNGQVPLDLYLQQEAEKSNVNHEHQHHSEVDSSNQLTAQDLFNLLNYNPANPNPLIPQVQLQQHVLQPNLFYNPILPIVPQSQHLDATQSILGHQNSHQFNPHYQTFNYDEQTQQGAYGSNSFPVSSMNLNFPVSNGLVHEKSNEKQNFEDNDVDGSERRESFVKVEENEIAQPQVESSKINPPLKDIPISTKSYSTNQYTASGDGVSQFTGVTNQLPVKPPNPQPINTQSPQETNEQLSAARSQEAEIPPKTEDNFDDQVESSQAQNPIKPQENVQLQKSIQIYENSYTSDDDLIKQEIKNLNDYSDDYTEEEKIIKEMNIGQSIVGQKQEQGKDNIHFVDAVPYGVRVRPKRF